MEASSTSPQKPQKKTEHSASVPETSLSSPCWCEENSVFYRFDVIEPGADDVIR